LDRFCKHSGRRRPDVQDSARLGLRERWHDGAERDWGALQPEDAQSEQHARCEHDNDLAAEPG
jgi:hypothetical protein